MHTKDKLADELMRIGLMDMSLKARDGYYHDFLSPLDLPEITLVNDLMGAAIAVGERDPSRRIPILVLRTRVINGDFDATTEESDEWAASPDGQETFRRLLRGD